MQNLRKNKNKVITTQMMNLTNEEAIDTETCDEMNRGCKGKPNNMYNNNNCGKQTCNECEPCHNHIHDHDKCIDPCKKHGCPSGRPGPCGKRSPPSGMMRPPPPLSRRS